MAWVQDYSTGDLSSTHREPDEVDVGRFEFLEKDEEVLGESVVGVADQGLVASPKPRRS